MDCLHSYFQLGSQNLSTDIIFIHNISGIYGH